jgi:diapolycopene oxygenase
MAASLDRFAAGAGGGYRRFMALSRRLQAISNRFFFWRPIGSLRDMFDPRTTFQPSMLADVMRMRPGRTVAATVRSYVHDPRVAQMLDHFTQYIGSAPDASPAVLCGIAHMQTGDGVWYPRAVFRSV